MVAIIAVGFVEPDAESAAGRWLALFTALSLAITHLARGAELRR